jgi:hypothetical protein
MRIVIGMPLELVGPVLVSPSGVERESLLEGLCYEARWGLASECAPIARGKGQPSQLGAWWVCHSGWGDGVMVVTESGSRMGRGLGGGTSDSDSAGGSEGM